MQIKKPRDLSLGDLPHIESPFSAGAIVSQQTNELTSSLRWQPTDVPGYEPNRPLPRHLALPILVSELRAGELFLGSAPPTASHSIRLSSGKKATRFQAAGPSPAKYSARTWSS